MRAQTLASLRRFAADQRGAFAVLAAILLPVSFLVAALAVDLAMLSLEKRRARAAVDLAAIVAAQNLADAEKAARTILSLNGHETVTEVELGNLAPEEEEATKAKARVKVERGAYARDAGTAKAMRFREGGAPRNAARVTMRKTGRYYFAAGLFPPPVYEVSAVASAQEIAAFSVGSRLARLNGGVANKLLSALTGSEVSLSLLDYNALLDAEVGLFSFLDALAFDLDLVSGRYAHVLAAEPTLGEALNALAKAAEGEGAGAASRALFRLADAASAGARRIDLARVVDLGPLAEIAVGGGESQGMPAKARVMDILFANAVVANGERLIDLDLGAGLPGLASVTARLAIGEAMQDSPWLRASEDHGVVSNVQIRLQIAAQLLGDGPLQSVSVRVPLYLEVARAEARLDSIYCPAGRAEAAEIDILARPGIADLWIGEADLTKPVTRDSDVSRARLVSAIGITAYAKARATVDNMNETRLSFGYDDIEAGRIKSTSTTDILESLMTSLGRDLELDIQVGGLNLGLGALARPALILTLGRALGALDDVVASLLETLGVTVGEADIRVNGVRCDRSVLVQ